MMDKSISTSSLPHREYMRRRRTLSPDEQANSVDTTSSRGVSAPLPAPASAPSRKCPSDAVSLSSLRCTRRRTPLHRLGDTHNQIQIHQQTNMTNTEQMTVPMPHELGGDPLEPKQAIGLVSCRKRNAEIPLHVEASKAPLSATHGGLSHREALKRRRMLLSDGIANLADTASSSEQPIVSRPHRKRKAMMAPTLHQENDIGDSTQVAASSSAQDSTVAEANRHRRGPNQVCSHCGAPFWKEERIRGQGSKDAPIYNKCCRGGSIALSSYKPPPEPLLGFLTGQDRNETTKHD